MTVQEIRSKAIKIFFILLLAMVVITAGYLTFVLNWSFSKGDRVGVVQKLSEKGWLCKTWEGELMMLPVQGMVPERFLFSVRDKALVNKINSSVGKRVSITYEQHKGIPTTCFGETEYFAVDIKTVQ
ncbi:MAG: hypothetical protein ACOYL3_10185 [Desulfuromonadaceae bacterium]